MPLSRYQIRNEYGLGDQKLYKLAGKDDSEALLEGVAMAGLVGLLRHLGDLAQFAAEVFHDLHEEVMATTARGHCLITRVQQLEAEFPVIEKTFLSQTNHTSFLYKPGVDWHPNLRIDQNMVTRGDLPRFVLDSYEECRGPPRLFLLDKFDVAGAGACLKRYTDPSFFKTESIPSNGRTSEGQREKKTQRVKKQAPHWRKGDTPESFTSSHAKLHQLFMEERLESDGNDPGRRVKLKKRQFTGSFLDQENKTSYMEKLLDMSPAEQRSVATTDGCEIGLEIVEIGTVSPLNEVMKTDRTLHSSPDLRELEMNPSMGDFGEGKVNETIDDEVVELPGLHRGSDTCKINNLLNGEDNMNTESNSQVSVDDGFDSEIDSYADAMATIESEVEVDSECRKISCYLNAKSPVADFNGSEGQGEPQSLFSDSQSLGNSTTSEDDNNCCKGRENSSCSTSGNSMAESTTDSEAHAVVTNVLASKSDPDDLSFELRHLSNGILGNETEEQARASNGALEVDDFPKGAEYSGELSNLSCLTGPNNTILPEDVEASLGKTSLPTPELAEECFDFANTSIVVGQSSSRRAEYEHWCTELTLNDDESPSVNDLTVPNLDACLGIKQSVAHPPTSDAVYPETMNQINVTPHVACFVSSTRENSEDPYSAPQCAESLNIQEFTALGEYHSIREVLPDTEAEENKSVGSITGVSEVLPPFSDVLQVHALKSYISDVIKAAETADSCHLETATLDTVSLAEKPSCNEVLGAANEAGEQCPGNSFSDHGNSVSVDENEQDSFLDAGSLQKDSGTQNITHGHRDRSEPAACSYLDDSGAQLIEIDAITEHECYNSRHDMSKDFSHDTSSKPAISSNSSLAAENNSAVNCNAVKVEHLELVASGSKEIDAEKNHHEHVTPLSSFEFLSAEKLKNLPFSQADPFYQNEEELVQDHIGDWATQKDGDATEDSLVNSLSYNGYGSLAEDIMNHRKLTDGMEAPLVSENNTRDMESTSLAKSCSYPSNELSGRGQAVLKTNPGQLETPSFTALDMLPAEPSIMLEPPPLPPLPPMQWRLGRFQNPPTAVQKQVSRPTPSSVSPVVIRTTSVETELVAGSTKTQGHRGYSEGDLTRQGVLVMPAAVACSDVSSQNDITGIGGEDICSLSASQISVTSQNGNETLGKSCPPGVNHLGSESRDEAHASGSCPILQDELSTEIEDENGQPEHVPRVTEQDPVNSNGELPQLSTELNDWHPHPGFVAPEMESMLLTTHERVPMSTNGNTNGTVQSKLQRPRNPLIDEVVAIDKSKLRKVEQVKPPVEPKGDEGESLLEQLQLRKVGERNKPLVESKTEELGLLLEQLQLRKVGERVKLGVDPRQEETESPRVQLRKVVGRSASMVGPKIEDRDSLLEQIRNKSFNLRPAVSARPLVQGPRTNLRVAAILQKASNIRQAMAGSDEEEDDDAASWSDC